LFQSIKHIVYQFGQCGNLNFFAVVPFGLVDCPKPLYKILQEPAGQSVATTGQPQNKASARTLPNPSHLGTDHHREMK